MTCSKTNTYVRATEVRPNDVLRVGNLPGKLMRVVRVRLSADSQWVHYDLTDGSTADLPEYADTEVILRRVQ